MHGATGRRAGSPVLVFEEEDFKDVKVGAVPKGRFEVCPSLARVSFAALGNAC